MMINFKIFLNLLFDVDLLILSVEFYISTPQQGESGMGEQEARLKNRHLYTK